MGMNLVKDWWCATASNSTYSRTECFVARVNYYFRNKLCRESKAREPWAECRDSRVHVHFGKLRNGQFVDANRHIVLTTGHIINFNIVSPSELARHCAGECVTVWVCRQNGTGWRYWPFGLSQCHVSHFNLCFRKTEHFLAVCGTISICIMLMHCWSSAKPQWNLFFQRLHWLIPNVLRLFPQQKPAGTWKLLFIDCEFSSFFFRNLRLAGRMVPGRAIFGIRSEIRNFHPATSGEFEIWVLQTRLAPRLSFKFRFEKLRNANSKSSSSICS